MVQGWRYAWRRLLRFVPGVYHPTGRVTQTTQYLARHWNEWSLKGVISPFICREQLTVPAAAATAATPAVVAAAAACLGARQPAQLWAQLSSAGAGRGAATLAPGQHPRHQRGGADAGNCSHADSGSARGALGIQDCRHLHKQQWGRGARHSSSSTGSGQAGWTCNV